MYECVYMDPHCHQKGPKLCPYPYLPFFFLERGEAAGADPGGTYQPGG